MGLDNGIVLKIKDTQRFGSIPAWMQDMHFSWEKDFVYDLCYWRKCYNIRGVILDLIPHEEWIDDYAASITLATLEKILNTLRDTCYNSEWWWENDESIWDWDTERKWDEDELKWVATTCSVSDSYWKRLTYAYRTLDLLATKDPESYTIEFYDSY